MTFPLLRLCPIITFGTYSLLKMAPLLHLASIVTLGTLITFGANFVLHLGPLLHLAPVSDYIWDPYYIWHQLLHL